ncbi:MAG: aspartate:alanine exchanger family transporter [Omnitrophica WOR_2 bacterium]
MSILLGEQMLVLFAILAIGSWLGGLSFKGITLGSAGVLFIAMLFGHFGLGVPRAVMDLGLLLFVYAVGLQAGPSFFRTFRSRGIQYVIIGLAAVLAGGIATLVVAASLHLPYDLASGLFTGALTCTPALASAVDVVERIAPGSSGNVSVGYGMAYPFSMIGVVLLVQFLPRLLGKNIRDEENRWKHERQAEAPSMLAKTFLISNPNLDGRSVSEINPHRLSQANISRIKHGDQVYSVVPDRVVHLGDVVMVVGTEEELSKMRLLLGEETVTRMDMNTSVVSMDIEVVEDSLVGKKLKDMRVFERYNVVITRIRRQGVELAPNGDTTLEMGDSIRVVGDQDATREFARLVHGSEGRAEETNMAPFLAGLLLGILVGVIPVNLPNGLVVRLGASGGAFLVSLLLGHFGRVGPLRLYVPVAARNLSRELGLMLFLAGAGANAGSHFVSVFQQQGVILVLAGIAIAAASALVALVLMNSLYKMNILSTLGALCACMTNPPGLSAANEQTETELPTVAYASVYPVALIFKIVLAQILVEVLRSAL